MDPELSNEVRDISSRRSGQLAANMSRLARPRCLHTSTTYKLRYSTRTSPGSLVFGKLFAIMKRPVHRIVDTHITPGNASVALF